MGYGRLTDGMPVAHIPGMPKVTVKRTGRTFGVFVNGVLSEGGFFSRDAAEQAAADLRTWHADIAKDVNL